MSDGRPIFIEDCFAIRGQNSVEPEANCNLMCPGTIRKSRNSLDQSIGVKVDYPTPTLSTACLPTDKVTCDTGAGSIFTDNTTIHCSATEGTKVVSTCSFLVQILDECLQDDQSKVSMGFKLTQVFGRALAGYSIRLPNGQLLEDVGPYQRTGNKVHIDGPFSGDPGHTQYTMSADFDGDAKTANVTVKLKDGTTFVLNDTNVGHGSCQ